MKGSKQDSKCFDCMNGYSDKCQWIEWMKPIKGWKVVRSTIYIDSVAVHYCPNFVPYPNAKETEKIPIACSECGKEFLPRRKTQKTCSEPCYKAWAHRMNMRSVICEKCGKEFFTSSKKQIYCNQECKRRKPKVVKFCKVCGVEITHMKHNAVYCSKACQNVVRAEVKRNAKHKHT